MYIISSYYSIIGVYSRLVSRVINPVSIGITMFYIPTMGIIDLTWNLVRMISNQINIYPQAINILSTDNTNLSTDISIVIHIYSYIH